MQLTIDRFVQYICGGLFIASIIFISLSVALTRENAKSFYSIEDLTCQDEHIQSCFTEYVKFDMDVSQRTTSTGNITSSTTIFDKQFEIILLQYPNNIIINSDIDLIINYIQQSDGLPFRDILNNIQDQGNICMSVTIFEITKSSDNFRSLIQENIDRNTGLTHVGFMRECDRNEFDINPNYLISETINDIIY